MDYPDSSVGVQETILIPLMDDFWWDCDGGSASVLALLDSQLPLIILIMVSFWASFESWGLVALYCAVSLPSSGVSFSWCC